MTHEAQRLEASNARTEHWKRWGSYLSERAWGTVREDYSPGGTAWEYLPHDHARSRAYRWNEDGIGGICDRHQKICFALGLWNGKDPILKERMFGLTGNEGNHGEDVKDCYYYLDSTPTHSYMKFLYKYPQRKFPYASLVNENRIRGRGDREFELIDTGIFDDHRYFDLFVEYAKATVDDVLIRACATNRGPEPAILHLLPTIWFRNTWSWGRDNRKPVLRESTSATIEATHHELGSYQLCCENAEEFLFTENDSNFQRLWGVTNRSGFVKDSINEAVLHNRIDLVNPNNIGTKAAAHYKFTILPNESRTIRLRLRKLDNPGSARASPALPREETLHNAFANFDSILAKRKTEADDFYDSLAPANLTFEHKAIQRQALAGLLWTKQFYYYIVEEWLAGDPASPPPPASRWSGRNSDWRHLYNERVMSMPDSWEFPWYASWDLAFHCIPLALVDPHFAKGQLDSVVREWYQHPNGQLPAYEWNFSDVNPPVLGW